MSSTAPSAPVPAPFGWRLAIGLIGVLIAALTSGLNDRVTDIALADVRGVFGIGYDEGTWISALYVAAEVSAMLVSPWLAMTFSLRRFALGATLAFGFLGLLCPLAPNLDTLLLLRVLQGLAGGALPPLLMTAALRFLPWHIKLYGLSAYALTATFGPNLAIPLAALWTNGLDWRLVFWQVVPACLVAAGCIAYGIPQDPLRLERFRQADWLGALFGCGSVTMLVIALLQGERLDWLESPLICTLLAGVAILFPLFLINEWFHPLPLVKLQLLGRRNFAFGNITLALFLIVGMSGVAIPSAYLTHIHGYRPLETMPVALWIALPQLVLAPLVATIINRKWVDSRWVIACGLCLITLACLGGSQLTSDWIRDDFYHLQILQTLGQPMIVVPLLMAATGVVHPMEGPFASATVNTIRGLFSVIGTALLEHFLTVREHIHSNVLLDRLGSAQPQLAPLLNDDTVAHLGQRIREQAFVLSFSDAYLALIGVCGLMLVVLLILPVRAFPPQPPVTP
ncbi:DHA2 family multidrug resistance protein [Pseudomonas duriflava]|uniref:DHA2 family multidrug resistance protein n=1 Tax=Pseudomonas duriflava TaxID=459528 RepID=A0A562Q8W8_9PSED|nr:MFS transporter [Pseudomonas duriflava]TWI52476.1 DHA2 family multidrug resistance protein [Pseudomonas duriflava]